MELYNAVALMFIGIALGAMISGAITDAEATKNADGTKVCGVCECPAEAADDTPPVAAHNALKAERQNDVGNNR